MNNRQVAHAWAHGQSGKGSNLYSDGQTLTSYRTTIAAKIDDVIYISADNMSPTTGRHLSYTRQAINYERSTIFRTPAFSWSGSNPALTHEAMILPAVRRAIQELESALTNIRTRQSTKNAAIMEYNARREEIEALAARVGVTLPDMSRIEATPEAIAQYQEEKRQAEERKEQARIAAAKKQQAEDAEQFKEWLQGVPVQFPRPYHRHGGTDYIKVSIGGDKVITSQGAEAPLEHVKKALRFYESRRNKAQYVQADGSTDYRFLDYHTNGHKIPLGIFTLDSIDEQGNVKAGCHYFKAAEIARFQDQWREVLQLCS